VEGVDFRYLTDGRKIKFLKFTHLLLNETKKRLKIKKPFCLGFKPQLLS
jgi:hypothetical protein